MNLRVANDYSKGNDMRPAVIGDKKVGQTRDYYAGKVGEVIFEDDENRKFSIVGQAQKGYSTEVFFANYHATTLKENSSIAAG